MSDSPERSQTSPRTKACRVCHRPMPPEVEGVICSDRCRMADLNQWLSGSYTISRSIEQADLEEAD